MRTSLSPGGESSRAVGVLLCAWGRFAGCSWQGAHALASPACWSMMLSPSPNPHPGSFLLLPSPLCPWNTLFSLQGLVPGAPLIPPALFLAPHTHLTASSLWAFLSAVSSPLRPHGPPPPPHQFLLDQPQLGSRARLFQRALPDHLPPLCAPSLGFLVSRHF